MKKPTTKPTTPFPPPEGEWLWIPLRNEWRDVSTKPEEIVRQDFVRHLVNELGYSIDQMDQERRIMHGHHSPRADIVVWENASAKAANKSPILVVECKAESIDIIERDYYQGESYTRASGCEFFVANNRRFTGVFRLIPGAPGEFVQINDIPKASDWGDAKRLAAIRAGQRAFNRREFQDLLFKCHSILRDVHKMDPGRAFDTMSKILFVKMYIERTGNHGTFTTDFLDQRAATRLPGEPEVHESLFQQTKNYYQADDLFAVGDKLDISAATFRRIVKELQRFDLSKTGDDIKGLAFERFLGNKAKAAAKAALEAGEKAWTAAKAAMREIDKRHDAALWAEVRERFDYPVFVASPKSVGITSTGETEGAANDLPGVLEALRAFLNWRDAGADPGAQPNFHLPFAA
jgi:type I restriction enzyme M protein